MATSTPRRDVVRLSMTADDVYAVAVQIERDGAAFYREAAVRIRRPATRTVLNRLAIEEGRHMDAFIELRRSLSSARKLRGTRPSIDEMNYIRAIADRHVFGAGAGAVEDMAPDASPEAILRLAIGKEKDSILFYRETADLLVPPTQRAGVERIVAEEKKHVLLLLLELDAIRKKTAGTRG